MSYDWCSSCGDVVACPHRPNEVIVRILTDAHDEPAVIRTTESWQQPS